MYVEQLYTFLFRFHYERMDELRVFLENEAFALCPVPLQFTLFDLQVRYLMLHHCSLPSVWDQWTWGELILSMA